MLRRNTSRRTVLGGAAALGGAWLVSAGPGHGAPSAGGGDVVDVASGAQLGKILYAGVAASGGKTYRLAADTDFGSQGVYNLDYSSNPITIIGQAGSVMPWLEIANVKGMTWRNFNIYGKQPGYGALTITSTCSGLIFDGVTLNTGTAEGSQMDGTGLYVRNVTTTPGGVQIIGRRDNAKPDIAGRGNPISLITSSGVLVKDLTLTNSGVDHILLKGTDSCTIDGVLAHNCYSGEGDHPDFIQAFNEGGATNRNLLVTNCGFQRGAGTGSQGYFFEGGQNITVKDCWWYDGLGNGFAISAADTVLVSDLYLAPVRGRGGQAAITTRGGSKNVTVENSFAGAIDAYSREGPYPGYTARGNTILRDIDVGDYRGLDAWLAARPQVRGRFAT